MLLNLPPALGIRLALRPLLRLGRFFRLALLWLWPERRGDVDRVAVAFVSIADGHAGYRGQWNHLLPRWLLATSAPPFAVLVLVAWVRGRAASGRMGRRAYVEKSEDVALYALICPASPTCPGDVVGCGGTR